MRGSAPYLAVGISAAAIAAVALLAGCKGDLRTEEILRHYEEKGNYVALTILYPLDGTLFPPEIVAPTFHWEDRQSKADAWLVSARK